MLIAKINLMLVGIRASADRHPVPFEEFPSAGGVLRLRSGVVILYLCVYYSFF
jgi:hypothetical protein